MSGSLENFVAALDRNTEAMLQHNAILTAMMEKAGTKPAPAATGDTTEKAKPGRPPKVKEVAVTLDGLKAEIGTWLGASAKGTPENAAKTDMLKKILAHVGAAKVPAIPADKLAEANDLFQQVKKGEDPFAEEGEEEAAEDELL